MATKSSRVKFSSRIHKLGINPVVDPPARAVEALARQAGRDRGPIPVRGRLNGVEFLQTLVKYRGAWRLYINGQMLKDSGLKVGDEAKIEIEFDPQPREVPIPVSFQNALQNNGPAKAAFEKLTDSRRNEILRYLGSLKTPASLERNIAKVISRLSGTS
jgi:hypothetical protein